jgi:tRNA-2-methylthio-N6-dimethylallyladenosine synthase
LAIQNEISDEDNASFIGRDVEVLVEGPSKAARKKLQSDAGSATSGPIQLVGRSTCDRIVVFEGNPRLAGSLARISIHDGTATTLIGTIVTRQVQHGSNTLLPILA